MLVRMVADGVVRMEDALSDEAMLAIDVVQAARLYASARRVHDDFIFRETARRMAERLATVRLVPQRVLDLGSGDGADETFLRDRFPDAWYCGLDRSLARLLSVTERRAVSGWRRWTRPAHRPPLVNADFASLPFAARSFDCLWSNLAIHWSSAPHRVIAEWSRVTNVGGLLTFSAFGPDTMREVVDAFAQVDDEKHVLPFTDLHDYGDMLVASGFVTPVVDAERIVLTYAEPADLWRDVRSLGGNAAIGRIRSLRGRAFRTALDEALATTRGPDGRYRLSLELVFAHAWKGETRKTAAGETIVRMPMPRVS